MKEEGPRVRGIEKVRRETPTVKSFRVRDPRSAEAEPGQFLMVWLPGSGEIPLAVSAVSGPRIEVTVKRRGETTEEFHELEPGDELGLRGPFGNGFTVSPGPSLLVGGGYAMAPLRYLYRSLPEEDKLHVVAGAGTGEELLYLDELEPDRLATEDGSRGREGDVIPPVEELLKEEEVERVYTAGPERMIYRLYRLCRDRGLALEASLERIMKCGVGLCGSCLVDGFRVCRDGPVADLEELSALDEFGKWERSPSGERKQI